MLAVSEAFGITAWLMLKDSGEGIDPFPQGERRPPTQPAMS
jgi:hypothetical protein